MRSAGGCGKRPYRCGFGFGFALAFAGAFECVVSPVNQEAEFVVVEIAVGVALLEFNLGGLGTGKPFFL